MYDVDILSTNPKKRREEAEANCDAVATKLTDAAFASLGSASQLSYEQFAQFVAANRQIAEFISYLFQRY